MAFAACPRKDFCRSVGATIYIVAPTERREFASTDLCDLLLM